MKISTQATGIGLLVSMKGTLDEVCAEPMKRELEAGLRQKEKFILFDFSGVSKVSATGFRCLLPFVQQIRLLGKQIILINLDDTIHGIIKNSGIKSCVILKDTLEEALDFASHSTVT